MNQIKLTIIYGFALFSMFFGSGNLVFPIQIGAQTGEHWYIGFIGLFLTGIILPFLGLFVIKIFRGNYYDFFNQTGKILGFILPLSMLSMLGSFGIVPRCITVAHGGLHYLLPELPLWIFSIIFSLITYFLCLKDQKMIKILGKWMSPILLLSLAVLIIMGVINQHFKSTPSLFSKTESFQKGFLTGYQTMDLFAAFFFSSLIFQQFQNQLSVKATYKDVIKLAIKPSILGAFLLTLIYCGFVYLGAKYQSTLTNVNPEYMLPTIAYQLLGKYSTILMSIAILFSCLTTAIALNKIYAQYLYKLFNVSSHKFYQVVIFTTGVSFIFSLLDFKGITRILVPFLEVTYPGIILLTILSLFKIVPLKVKQISFYITTICMIYKYFI